MRLELNPNLLDVVEFKDSSLGTTVKRTGTVVEAFGVPPKAVLIEVADSQGVPESFVTKNVEDIQRVWQTKTTAEHATPKEAQHYFENGFLYLQNGVFGRAKEQFAKAFSLDLTLRASLLESTNVLARKGKHDAAIGDFKTALMLRPRRPESLELIQKNLVAAYTHLAVQHSDMKLYSEAVGYFVLAFELGPADLTQRNLAIALIAASVPKTEGVSGVPGEDFFRQATQMGLTLSQCLNAYGATLAHHGRIPEAVRALEKAVHVDPKNEMARKNLETLLRPEPPGDLPTGLMPLEPREM